MRICQEHGVELATYVALDGREFTIECNDCVKKQRNDLRTRLAEVEKELKGREAEGKELASQVATTEQEKESMRQRITLIESGRIRYKQALEEIAESHDSWCCPRIATEELRGEEGK